MEINIRFQWLSPGEVRPTDEFPDGEAPGTVKKVDEYIPIPGVGDFVSFVGPSYKVRSRHFNKLSRGWFITIVVENATDEEVMAALRE